MRIGELFILGFYGTKIPQWLLEFEKAFGLGGIIFFDYYCQTKKYDNNINNPQQLKLLCKEVSSLGSKPLIFIDQEGGLVRRLKEKYGFVPLPSHQDFNLLSTAEKESIASKSYEEMKEVGINFNFAPVIDININPENPDIGKIMENVKIVNKVATRVNMGLCLKHYPGIGAAKVNSHEEIMDITGVLTDEQENLFYQLSPSASGNAILLSHAYVKTWDKENPVSISPKAIARIRRQLPETLLISDDMQMQGMQKIYGTKNACQLAVAAGIDMLCIGNNLLDEESKMQETAAALQEFCRKNPKVFDNALNSINRVAERKKSFK